MSPPERQSSLQAPPLLVSVGSTTTGRQDFRFDRPFRIGRADDCDVRIQDDFVSRYMAAVTYVNGQWWIQDLKSSNGIFIGDQRVTAAPVGQQLMVRLGTGGPFVRLQLEPPPAPPPAPPAPIQEQMPAPQKQTPVAQEQSPVGTNTMMVAKYAEHYFGATAAEEKVGQRTMMIRLAFQKVQAKQRWKYGRILGVLVLALLGLGGYALYQYRQASQQRILAQEIFYSMKDLDVSIAGLEKLILDSNSRQGAEQIRKYQDRRREMEKNYNRFLSTLRVYDPKMSEQDRLILRIARVFGECELAIPPGFKEEVRNYISKWQSSGRFANAVAIARERGYTRRITDELLSQNLPPHLYYLALQESNFEAYASGPPTYMGIAKGMWQFVPETAMKYGLRIGPLADFRRPDPADERHQWEKATKAAAAYLKDIYTTDAQASGLLVMASYNWGEQKVIRLIRSMPANPRDRNFWRLLTDHRDKIPAETYDYVFYIVSAAVIGENPRLFGFQMESPLAHLEAK